MSPSGIDATKMLLGRYIFNHKRIRNQFFRNFRFECVFLSDIEETASDSNSQPSDTDDPPNTSNNDGVNETENDDVYDPANVEINETVNSGKQEEPTQGVDAGTTAGSSSDHD